MPRDETRKFFVKGAKHILNEMKDNDATEFTGIFSFFTS